MENLSARRIVRPVLRSPEDESGSLKSGHVRLHGIGDIAVIDALLQIEVARPLPCQCLEHEPRDAWRLGHYEADDGSELLLVPGHQRVASALGNDPLALALGGAQHTAGIDQPQAFHIASVERGIDEGDLSAHRMAREMEMTYADRMHKVSQPRSLRRRRVVHIQG